MTDNIIELPKKPAPNNDAVIARLEEILEEAKQGKITSIAVCGTDALGNTWTGYEAGDHWAKLLGAVTFLQHRLTEHVEE